MNFLIIAMHRPKREAICLDVLLFNDKLFHDPLEAKSLAKKHFLGDFLSCVREFFPIHYFLNENLCLIPESKRQKCILRFLEWPLIHIGALCSTNIYISERSHQCLILQGNGYQSGQKVNTTNLRGSLQSQPSLSLGHRKYGVHPRPHRKRATSVSKISRLVLSRVEYRYSPNPANVRQS